MSAPPPVIVRYCPVARHWQAWFDGCPCLSYGSDIPMRSVCRLLRESATDPSAITLLCDRDMIGSGVLTYEAVWKPPELLFLCQQCHGNGECLVFPDVEKCQRCMGRGWLVG